MALLAALTLKGSIFAFGKVEPTAVVWAVGDGANGSNESKALARRIVAARSTAFLYLGDVYENGTYEEFRRNYAPAYGRVARKTMPTPGNHEWANHKTGYDRYWSEVRGRRRVDPYYSFELGGWQILSLNSEMAHGPGSRQLAWLKDRLGDGNCRVAFWHRPRFSTGTHGDQIDMDPVWQTLRGRAALVLSGHDHGSQRFRPRDGIVQVVAGAGGVSFYPLRPDRRVAFANARDPAAVQLTLTPTKARVAFVATSGRRLDVSEVPCRR